MSIVVIPDIHRPAISAGSVSPVVADDGQTRGAWMREMENAQIDAWLSHPVPVTASNMTLPVLKESHSSPYTLRSVLPVTSAQNHTKPQEPSLIPAKLISDAQLKPQDQGLPIRPSATAGTPQGQMTTSVVHTGFAESSLPQAIAACCFSSATRSSAAADTATRNPVRVYVQESPEGLHLWIGLDVQEQKNMAALVADVMACLDAQGIRLARLVCNGRVLYQSSGSQPAHPSFLTQSIYNQES